MSHHVPGPPDYDVVMTEQVPGLNGPKMLGRHKPTAPYPFKTFYIRNDPSGEGMIEKEDLRKDDEAGEISEKMRKERSYYPTR